MLCINRQFYLLKAFNYSKKFYNIYQESLNNESASIFKKLKGKEVCKCKQRLKTSNR